MTRSARPSAYDEDFFTWTQDQALALRRLNERGGIDVEHLAEEVEDLGRRDLRDVKSLLRLLLLRLMKIAAEPEAPMHWRSEAREFRRAAMEAFTPGMRQLIDVPTLWRGAAERLADDFRDLGKPQPSIAACPFELDDIFSGSFDLDAALAEVTTARHMSTAIERPRG